MEAECLVVVVVDDDDVNNFCHMVVIQKITKDAHEETISVLRYNSQMLFERVRALMALVLGTSCTWMIGCIEARRRSLAEVTANQIMSS